MHAHAHGGARGTSVIHSASIATSNAQVGSELKVAAPGTRSPRACVSDFLGLPACPAHACAPRAPAHMRVYRGCKGEGTGAGAGIVSTCEYAGGGASSYTESGRLARMSRMCAPGLRAGAPASSVSERIELARGISPGFRRLSCALAR